MIVAGVATDPTPIVSVVIALSATVTAAFAYRRGRKADDKSNSLAYKTHDLDTLREIVKSLERDRDNKNADIVRLNERLDHCESEKDSLQIKVFDLQLEVYKLKVKSDG